jgi:hypothetical protein
MVIEAGGANTGSAVVLVCVLEEKIIRPPVTCSKSSVDNVVMFCVMVSFLVGFDKRI